MVQFRPRQRIEARKSDFRPVCFLSILLFGLCIPSTQGQSCNHTRLSAKYNFTTSLTRKANGHGLDSLALTLTIARKTQRGEAQKIRIKPYFLFHDAFTNPNAVRSYTTGLNERAIVIDNDFGDLVVADLNFDGADDIALKKDSGGNSGPVYNFYLQDHKGRFVLDTFLTHQMEFFPEISKAHRTLTTHGHANAYQMSERVYKLNPVTMQWKRIRKRLLTFP